MVGDYTERHSCEPSCELVGNPQKEDKFVAVGNLVEQKNLISAKIL